MVSLNYGLLWSIGSQQAGLGNIADPALLQVGNALRLFFKNANEPQIPIAGFDNKIHSYISSDNGKTWTLESGIRIDVLSPVTVQPAAAGGYEAWSWVNGGGGAAMTRFTSVDGKDFIKGSGNVVNASACKGIDGAAAEFLGDPQVVKVASGYLAFAQDIQTGNPPFKRHACALTSSDGITWALDISKTIALQNDIMTNPETYRNSSSVIEQILPIDKLDRATSLRSGMQIRTSTNDGVSWTELSELSFFGGDPDRLDLSNGDSLLAFGNFDYRLGGVLAVTKKISTSYKASRMEKGRETIIWTISGAKQSEITVKNLCLNKDLTSSSTFAASGSNITVTFVDSAARGVRCVYALIGSEQAIK